MGAKILYKDRAVLVEDDGIKILAIADIHLNDEDESVHEIIKRAKLLIKKHKPNFLVIDGDMLNFHIGGESLDLLDIELSKMVNVLLMQGNHEPEFFEPALATTNYCFCHGNIDYQIDKNLILGHTHPFFNGEPVFLKGTLKNGKEFIVLPPFNEESLGPDVKESKDDLMGFIFQNKLVKSCEAYSLEGKKLTDLKF